MGSKNRSTNNPKAHRKNGKKTALKLFLAVALMCLLLVAVLCFTVLFKTKSVAVKGNSIYAPEKIIEASGIKAGDNMLVSMFFGVENKIEKALPYVLEADVDRNLNGNVVITVKPAVADRCFKNGEKFVYSCAEGKVLEVADNPLENGIVISGVNLSGFTPGEKLSLSDERSEKLVSQIVQSAANHKLTVNSIATDAEFKFVDVIVNGKYLVHLMNDSDIDYKLLHISDSIGRIPGEEGGTFTFSESNNGKTVFKAGDIFAPEEELPEPLPEENEGENAEESVENTNS